MPIAQKMIKKCICINFLLKMSSKNLFGKKIEKLNEQMLIQLFWSIVCLNIFFLVVQGFNS